MAQTRTVEQDIRALKAAPEQYQRYRLPLFDGGLRTDKAAVDLQPNEVPTLTNLQILRGVLRPDTGYSVFGTVCGGSPFIGAVQKTFQQFDTIGLSIEFLVTTQTVYSLNSQFNQWQIVPWGGFYHNVGVLSAGATTATLASVSGLAVGSVLGLPLDNGEQLPVTVSAIVGSTVTFSPAMPVGRTVPNTADICLGAALRGSYSNAVCIVPFVGQGWTIFTNGIDPLFYYDGSKLASLVADSDLPALTTCVWMIVFHNCLFLLDTTENGTNRPQRVRMSDLGDPLAWTPGSSSSIAAIYDLLDTDDFINTASIIGPYLILYRDESIMRGTYLGAPQQTIFWEYVIKGEGTLVVDGVTKIGAQDLFFGNSSVYTYTGDYTLESVGDPVYEGFLGSLGDLNPVAKPTAFTQYIGDFDEAWLFYPVGTSTLPNRTLRCSLEKSAWFIRQFANKFVSCEPYLGVADTTWQSAVGTWAEQTSVWVSRAFRANVPVYIMCAGDDNLVYVYDYTATTDAGAAIAWSVQTKDISAGDEMQRWDSVRAYGQGTALCETSTDGGVTWQTVGTFAFGSTLSQKVLTFQAVSPYIRFRLSGGDPTFRLSWMEVWYLFESEW